MKRLFLIICYLIAIAANAQYVVVDRMESDGSRQIMTKSKEYYIPQKYYDIGLKAFVREGAIDWYLLVSSYHSIPDDNVVLFKLNDGQVLTFHAINSNSGEVQESYDYIYFYGNVGVFMHGSSTQYYSSIYKISLAELDSIQVHGISKIRIGNNVQYAEKIWRNNSLGKYIAKSKKVILDRLRATGTNNRRTIYDGF